MVSSLVKIITCEIFLTLAILLLFYSQNNVLENAQESLDDFEPPNFEENTPSTSKAHHNDYKWLVQ